MYGTCQIRFLSTSPPSPTSPTATKAPLSKLPDTSGINDEPDVIVIDSVIQIKNVVLASLLVAFCVGVATYSMNAVGQAGSGGSDDPLAALKQEAAAAQVKSEQAALQTESTVDMLQQFQAGAYDPDRIDDDDENESIEKNEKKRAWWKFW